MPQAQPPQPAATQFPPISPADRANYAQLFARNATNGFIDGQGASSIFLKFGLPNRTLADIWNLCDSQNRGQLDQGEFILAMHLIRSTINRTISQLPSTLPPAALEAMKTGTRNAGRSVSSSSNNSVRYNQGFTPGSPAARVSPVTRQYTGPLQHPQLKATGSTEGVISLQERAKFDSIFTGLDKKGQGVIGAEEVVPFLTTSKLSEETLAQIWDLADIHNTGEFRKEEFAIAMYLVQQQLAGKPLPATLPSALYQEPQSKPDASYFPQQQRQQRPPATNTYKPPAVANSSLNDLLSLGDSLSTPSPPAPLPKVSENRTGSFSNQGIASQFTGARSAFVPTSSFGQSLADKEPTSRNVSATFPSTSEPSASALLFSSQPPLGSSADLAISSPIPQKPQSMSTFDTEYANKLSTISTENANFTNQVNSMSTQTDQARQKRERAEAELSRVLALKSSLESRLATIRAEYDLEIKKSNQAEQMLHESQKETDKLSSEASVLEASYHAVRSQCQEISSQLTYDQQENANLKEKIRFVNEETANLKQTLEKLQKDARQQKGLVAINRKQYTYAESERDKIQSQIDEASQQPFESRDIQASSSHSGSVGVPGAVLGVAAVTALGSASSTGIASPTPSHLQSIPQNAANSTNPFYGSFASTQQQHITFTDETPSLSSGFEDRFSQMGIASPSTAEPARSSTHNTVDTPNSSPPNSDYQYNAGNAAIPTFTLPLARPESATSSVQNNPPMSVRDDIDVSRPDSPEFPVTSEPVSGIVPPEDLVIRSVGGSYPSQYPYANTSAPYDAEASNTGSLEADSRLAGTGSRPSTTAESVFSPSSASVETTTPPALQGSVSQSASTLSFPASSTLAPASQPVVSQHTGSTIEAVATDPTQSLSTEVNQTLSGSSQETKDANKDFDNAFKSLQTTATGSAPWPATANGEFPPIRELEYEDSSSDEEDAAAKAFAPNSGFAPAVASTSAGFPSTASTERSQDLFVSATASPAVPAFAQGSASISSPVPSHLAEGFQGSSAFAPSAPFASTFPPALPAKEVDPFDAAFDGLVVADEEKEEPPLNFGINNAPFNFEHPAQAAAPFGSQADVFSPVSASSLASPPSSTQGKSVFDFFPSDNAPLDPANTGVPVSNEEWDSIFAGFGSPNQSVSAPVAQPASQVEINTAFSKPQAAAFPQASPVQTQAVNELVGMGFGQEKALEALKKNNFNVENAGNYLLDH